MTDTPPIPIVVNDSAVPAQIGVTVRQVMLLLGGWAVGKGYLDNDTLATLTTLSVLIVPLVWGQWQRWNDHREKRALAISAPIGSLK